MTFMMNKLAMINFCEIILEKIKNNKNKNYCEIQVHTILVCALYSIKYGILKTTFSLHILEEVALNNSSLLLKTQK